MQFRVLGPVEVVTAGAGPVELSAAKPRTVLAVLVCARNSAVSTDRLIDAVWGADPPRTAAQNLRSYVHQLRRALGEPGRIVWRPGGYVLLTSPGEVDADRFAVLAGQGTAALAAGDAGQTAALLRQALGLWRGPAYAGLDDIGLLRDEVARLTECRHAVLETRIDADLALGRHGELVAELGVLVAADPLRERWRAQLMRALHRSGRQADALAVYRETRRLLADELGLEPGSELRALEQAILRGQPDPSSTPPPASPPTPPAPAPVPVVPALLPSDMRGFTGRAAHLHQLDAIAAAAGQHPTAVIISAVSGMAGVGKTALAVHWAHRIRDRFGDGQLYVNLRGFDPGGQPMTPAEAVRGFLDALAVAPERIPADVDAQAGLYRSLLAGKRMLIVLDNARDAAQVRPLLPGAPGCLVLVTSRTQLSSLVATEGAHPLVLDVLTAREARQLLAGRLGGDRITAELQAIDDIIASCARLPLALAIVAARAACHPHFPLPALAGELRDTRARLDALAGEDPTTDVRTVFSWSYDQLSSHAARLFRLLGLHPGPDTTAPAAASPAGRADPRAPDRRTHPRPVHPPRPAARLRHRPNPPPRP